MPANSASLSTIPGPPVPVILSRLIRPNISCNLAWRDRFLLITFPSSVKNANHSAQRPWNWWSQKSAGGGLLGALGSHAIDALRWLFGEIDSVCSVVTTMIPERKDAKTGEMRPNETDDYVSFLVKFAPRENRLAHGAVMLSALYASGGKNQITAVGSNGTLMIEGDEMLLGAIGYNQQFEDMSLADRALEIAVIPNNIWARSFYHLARETVQALREGRSEISHAATFADGVHCQRVIDAVLRSNEEQRWISIGD